MALAPNRFDYAPITERPVIKWPNNARVAFWVAPNMEFFEYLPESRPTQPDIPFYARMDYGNRVGFWRMLDVLNKHKVRACCCLNLELLDHFPYVDDPLLARCLQCFDQIACVHMSGLFARSHMNAGQDGFRDKSSKQKSDLIEGHWKMRDYSRRGSIDHTTCSLSCKFWHQLSTVAVELLPVSG